MVSERIEHSGIVDRVVRGTVYVRITSPDAAEGVDYTVEGEAFLPANATNFDFQITLYRTEELKSQTKRLVVELAANDCFCIPFTELIQSGGDTVSTVRYTIYFSDQFTAPPAGWSSSPACPTPSGWRRRRA